MNHIFQSVLNKLVVVYLNDIVICSNIIKAHVKHLQNMFKVFQENKLYVKKK